MINRKLNTSVKKGKKNPYYFFLGDYKIPLNLCIFMKYIQMKHNEENTKHLITIIGFLL